MKNITTYISEKLITEKFSLSDKIQFWISKNIFKIDVKTQDQYLKEIKSFVDKKSEGKVGVVTRSPKQLLDDEQNVLNIEDKWFDTDKETFKDLMTAYIENGSKHDYDGLRDHNIIVCLYRKDYPKYLYLEWDSAMCFCPKDKNGNRTFKGTLWLDNAPKGHENFTFGNKIELDIDYLLNKFHPENISKKIT